MITTIKKYREIKHALDNGRRFVRPSFVVCSFYRAKGDGDECVYSRYKEGPLFAFFVTRKFGKAHERNLGKRRLRAIVAEQMLNFDRRKVYIFVLRASMKSARFADIREDFLVFLRNAGGLRRGRRGGGSAPSS